MRPLSLSNGRQLEKSEPMSWRGNRPVPTGVQAGREIGARSGWGRILQGCRGHPEHHPISWSGAGRWKKELQKWRSVAKVKLNWNGSICGGCLKSVFTQEQNVYHKLWTMQYPTLYCPIHDITCFLLMLHCFVLYWLGGQTFLGHIFKSKCWGQDFEGQHLSTNICGQNFVMDIKMLWSLCPHTV